MYTDKKCERGNGMLKKILGEAPFDVELDKKVIITPGKKTSVKLLFNNISEYDLPLSASINFSVSAEVDKTRFDIIVPADGKTECVLTFSKDKASRMFSGIGIAELEIIDRIFDSKTLYEFDIVCEAAYKCAEETEGFEASEDVVFTNKGRFFANKGETVFVQVPLMEAVQYKLFVLSGKIKDKADGEILNLTPGLNKLCFTMLEDGSFEFRDPSSDETVYPDTLNTKYFI